MRTTTNYFDDLRTPKGAREFDGTGHHVDTMDDVVDVATGCFVLVSRTDRVQISSSGLKNIHGTGATKFALVAKPCKTNSKERMNV